MEIILKVSGTDLFMRREELVIPDGHQDVFSENQVVIQPALVGSFVNDQLSTGNFYIDYYTGQLAQPIQLIREVEADVIQLFFALQGDSQYFIDKSVAPQDVNTGQHTICYTPRSTSRFDFPESDLPLDYCVVVIPLEVYFRLLPSGLPLNRHFVAHMVQGKATFMTPQKFTMTSAMEWLIRDIRTSQRTGSFKRLLIESRVTELLLLQLEQLQGSPAVEPPAQKAAIRKLNEARDLLDTSYASPPTIVELAKLVGLNEFSLKRGFKAQFRTTILGYITQRRMEEAKRFLLEGEKSIGEISYWVGYKNPAHFTVAFKHYFGVLPSTIRTHADDSTRSIH
ncbi:helix-turn-helix transcriptional regulator [Fibrella arboris]|uniref:helix-turn-helix transcriptional regulator n=1 Tax=Fibrella arboris TaxID=3242486 RepID=UPI00352112D7